MSLCLLVTGLGDFHRQPCPRDSDCILPWPSACPCSQQLQASHHCRCGICSDESSRTLSHDNHIRVCPYQSEHRPCQRRVSSTVVWLLHLCHILRDSRGSDNTPHVVCQDQFHVCWLCHNGSVCCSTGQQFIQLCQ